MFIAAIALIILVCYGATATFAVEETPIDYADLFAKSIEVDPQRISLLPRLKGILLKACIPGIYTAPFRHMSHMVNIK